MDALERESRAEKKVSSVREAFPEIVEEKETVFDLTIGRRRVLNHHRAVEIFGPLKEPGNSYTKILFGDTSFGVEAALAAKDALQGVQKTLKDVELVDFYFKRSEAEALEVVSIFSSAFEGCVLRSLSLDLVQLGEKGLSAVEPLLKSQKMLEELEFVSTAISVKFARDIDEFLPSLERIKCLRFYENVLGDDAVEALSVLVIKCTALLEKFEFSGSWIGTRGAKALAKALRQGGGLKTLHLCQNMFGPIGGVALSQVIPGHLGLTEVFFNNMYLEDEGATAIAHSLKDAAPSLRVLGVGGNYITREAAPALAECLAVKKLLTMFNARDNLLRDDGSVVICKAISEGHEQLKELDLSANGMTITGAMAAVEAVANKPDFSRLLIYHNLIKMREIGTIEDVLSKGTKGDSVLLPLADRRRLGMTDSDSEFREKLIKMEVRHPKKRKVKHGSDTDTELEKKLHKPKVRYGMKTY